MRDPRRGLRAAAFIALSALAAVMAGAQAAALGYTLAIDPPRPEAGALVLVTLSVRGVSVSSSRVDELRLGPGLTLESESRKPFVSASSRGTAFRFGLRLSGAGEARIESLAIRAAEGTLRLGPIVLRAGARAGGRNSSFLLYFYMYNIFFYFIYIYIVISIG